MGASAGGVFLPNDPPPSTGQVLTTPTISSPTLTGTMTGTFTISGSTLVAPVISGAATVASGSTLTTPTIVVTTTGVTATGTGSGDGATMPTVYPAFVTITGAASSGVKLLTGPAGSSFFLDNAVAGTIKVYCPGGTINGTTGTTSYDITNTGNSSAWAYCTTATGAWRIKGNT